MHSRNTAILMCTVMIAIIASPWTAALAAPSATIYAGIFVYDMSASPLSPFAHEKVHFDFKIFDLSYLYYEMPLNTQIKITDAATGNTIFVTPPMQVTDGKVAQDFVFPREGTFNVTLNVWKSNEPNIVRDGTLPVQVRLAPESPWHTWASGFGGGLGIGALVLWSMQFAHRKRKARHA